MGPWGPKMGVPPKKAPIFKEDAFPEVIVVFPRRVTTTILP